MILTTLGAAHGFKPGRAAATCCPIVELRQYTLQPGQRDVLIDMFDRIFVDALDTVGVTVIGQFRDLDNPDRFVWLRGFPDMATRPKGLDAFYTGAIWQQHRNAANATMVDVSNVLLLHPLQPAAGLTLGKRPDAEGAVGIVEITVYAFDTAVDTKAIARIDREIESAGAHALATFVTEKSPNNYPRLPVRENENVLVRVASFSTATAYDQHREALARSPQWQAFATGLRAKLKSDPQILRLAPTARSLLHG